MIKLKIGFGICNIPCKKRWHWLATKVYDSQPLAFGSTVALGMAKSTFNYWNDHSNAVGQWEEDLAENQKTETACEFLKSNDKQLKVGTVSIRENRTIPTILSFEPGLDLIFLPVDGSTPRL